MYYSLTRAVSNALPFGRRFDARPAFRRPPYYLDAHRQSSRLQSITRESCSLSSWRRQLSQNQSHLLHYPSPSPKSGRLNGFAHAESGFGTPGVAKRSDIRRLQTSFDPFRHSPINGLAPMLRAMMPYFTSVRVVNLINLMHHILVETYRFAVNNRSLQSIYCL